MNYGGTGRVARKRIANAPDILIADEPGGKSDPKQAGNSGSLYKVNRLGTTVVVVTHDNV